MRAVVQRVSRASVRVEGVTVGEIGRGILVLLGLGQADTEADADWLVAKLLALRIFPDDGGKMNRSVTDVGGGVLVVSQFTLYGDARKGTRPSFSEAMAPAAAEALYGRLMAKLRAATTLRVAEGRFAAMMEVELVNDGPVTIILDNSVGQASRLSVPSPEAVSPIPASPGPAEGLFLPFVPFDPALAVARHNRHLPHWSQAGCTYFVTFRLADSLPANKLRQWTAERDLWLRNHAAPYSEAEQRQYQELFSDRWERWLDAGYGDCWLRQSSVARVVAGALRHFHGERYVLGGFVVMPNHVHVLVALLGEYDLSGILHSWKSWSAKEVNRVLERTGVFWQDESFDHLVRQEGALERFQEYLRQNPADAGLEDGEYYLEMTTGAGRDRD